MGSLRSWELVLSQRWVSFLVLVYSFMKPVADVVFLKAGVYRSVGEELCLEGGLYRKGAESDTRYVSCFALIYDHMRSIRRLFVPLFTCLLSESVRVEITCDGLARFRLGRGENIHRQNYVCRCNTSTSNKASQREAANASISVPSTHLSNSHIQFECVVSVGWSMMTPVAEDLLEINWSK